MHTTEKTRCETKSTVCVILLLYDMNEALVRYGQDANPAKTLSCETPPKLPSSSWVGVRSWE